MDTNSESDSLNSLSIPPSLRTATKEKFDILLKTALGQKSASREKLIDTLEAATASDTSVNWLDTNGVKDTNVDYRGNVEEANKKYILHKFLTDSNHTTINNETGDAGIFKIPPVPKPRKKYKNLEQRRNSNSSAHTFDVVSTKFCKDNSIEKSCSYKIEKQAKNGTNLEQVGDVLIHNSPIISKVSVYAENHEILENADIEILDDKKFSNYNSSSTSVASYLGNVQQVNINEDKSFEIIRLKDNATKSDINENGLNKPVPKKRHKQEALTETLIQDTTKASRNQNQLDYKFLTEIVIHKTDRLKLNPYVLHPVVKVHIVNNETGEYYTKSDQNRPVVFYYENNNNNYILPVMTSYYDLQVKRSFFPSWEEIILLNEDFEYLINDKIIIFFEILDFAPISLKSLNYSLNKRIDKGWLRIAFAFLKPIGKKNVSNVNKMVRLQLYYPGNVTKTNQNTNKCYLWQWHQKKLFKKYPSTLYVTIRKIISPKKVIQTFRSKTPLQEENIISNNGDEYLKTVETGNSKENNGSKHLTWARSENKCMLPNKCVAELDSYEEGCLLMKFSCNGFYLACVVKIENEFSVVIYQTKDFEEYTKFTSHQGLIYSVNWSQDDSLLLMASADNTASIWNFERKLFLQILPHPTFVYSSDINAENTVATGCYDKIIRIWHFNRENTSCKLFQELEGHEGYVTSICFSVKTPDTLFSADSVGKIIQWNANEPEWKYKRHIQIMELNGTIINQILLFPHEKRMLVHARDSCLRIVSINNSCVLHWLHGALNTRVQTICSISPHGDYILCGSENGLVIVWNAKTGKDVHTYYAFTSTVHCAQFHPRENILAVSHYGSKLPILLYCYLESEKGERQIGERQKFTSSDRKVINNESRNVNTEKKLDFQKILQKMDTILKL